MTTSRKWIIGVLFLIAALGAGYYGYRYTAYLHNAHCSFENYYSFRGCTSLVDRTDAYGDCTLSDGTMIRIVLFRDQWYLDRDLPICIGRLCF